MITDHDIEFLERELDQADESGEAAHQVLHGTPTTATEIAQLIQYRNHRKRVFEIIRELVKQYKASVPQL